MSYIEISANVDVDDILDELGDKELLEEVESRHLLDEVVPKKRSDNSIIINPYDFRRLVCDMLDCGYCVSDGDLVKALLEKIH
ncbi:MAG: hypothetical protein RSB32_06210 [Mucinivorans sp.]